MYTHINNSEILPSPLTLQTIDFSNALHLMYLSYESVFKTIVVNV